MTNATEQITNKQHAFKKSYVNGRFRRHVGNTYSMRYETAFAWIAE